MGIILFSTYCLGTDEYSDAMPPFSSPFDDALLRTQTTTFRRKEWLSDVPQFRVAIRDMVSEDEKIVECLATHGTPLGCLILWSVMLVYMAGPSLRSAIWSSESL